LGLEVNPGQLQVAELRKLIDGKREQTAEHTTTQLWEDSQVVESVTLAYMGTTYSITVPLTDNMIDDFEKRHKQINGFSFPTKKYKL
jgi:N-methylhydantoinase A/oxoprolinase/acetone carboxylase beta subunit